MATCASCSAPIRWATSAATGKPVPLDEAPHEDGTVQIRGATAHVLNKHDLDARRNLPPEQRTPVYRSHFATCPHAAGWRAPARKETARG